MDLLLELCGEEKVTLLLVTHAEEVAARCPDRFDCSALIRETAS
jgi:predicted ABC-type transport system involved in lysophospholipase L1 biosynthesis ATPase subunit